MTDDLKQRAWNALVRELGAEEAARFWREAGLDGASPSPEALGSQTMPSSPSLPLTEPWSSAPPPRQSDVVRPARPTVTAARVPWHNPVLTLALRRHMRHLSAFGLQLAYVGLLAVIFLIVEDVVVRQSVNAGRPLALIGPQIGRAFWLTSSLIQIMGLGLVGAVLGACAFAVEREQRTSDALWLTLLRPWDLLLGKSVALFAFLILLVFSGLPLLCLTFLFGGVSPGDVARANALLLACTAGTLGVGLFCSTCSRRAIRAIVAAALITGAFLFGVPALAVLFASMYNFGPNSPVFAAVVVLNPLLAMGHLFTPMRPLPPGLSDGCTLFYTGLALATWLAAWLRLVVDSRGRR
jgi:ABC-type transport system involved in multi-copper enzyme maturation permease subunit